MSLSTNELRSRAAAFAAGHAGDRDERRDTHTFWNDFLKMFGVSRRDVGIYEQAVTKITGAQGFIDLFWPSVIVIEQKSLGRDLVKAAEQANDYILALHEAERPRYRLVSDFRTFILFDYETRSELTFQLSRLPDHIDAFSFILGQKVRALKDQDPVNIRAAELMGKLHDLLEGSGYTGHRLEVFLTRIVFCLFADDTGIFQPRDRLWNYLDQRTKPDGSDMGARLSELFDVLNTPEDRRQRTLDPEVAAFPHVNGGLFADHFQAPAFDTHMRAALLNACRFDWTPISPAIFGSLFQSVMDARERRAKGAHYTTERNILKLIGPLFMDDLRAEFAHIRGLRTGRTQRLRAFHDRLAGLTFFDPACGCGNFLVIAYRELRRLELELLRELRTDGQLALDAADLSRVDVDQFFGIEIEEFPARIAETAMWMMDHLMNLELSEAFGGYRPRIPLKASPTILHGDALEVDWATVLPPERCSYVLGNPPFIGAKFQSPVQRGQVRRSAGLGRSGGTLDYVAAWFIKAARYATGPTRIAFVSTNSITQGEQVAQLWPLLFKAGWEIGFAHRTFPWGSDARGKAHVHVVILGLDPAASVRPVRPLYDYPDAKGDPVRSEHTAISPYLFDAGRLTDPHVTVREEPRPINGMPRIIIGSKPIDGGYYILSPQERAALVATEPGAAAFIHPYVGSREFLQGGERFILHLGDAPPNALRDLRQVRALIEKVRAYRLGQIPAKRKAEEQAKEPGISSRALAETPRAFHVTVVPVAPFLVLPEVSSERRKYAPIAWMEPPVIPSNKLKILADATLTDFALLTSAMHMAWMRAVTGRMKSDYMYSVGVVYNTFPLPPATASLARLDPLAQAILDARAVHPNATLADLYDPDLMPANLRQAHAALDRAVDRLYRPQPFASDRERVEHLFARYAAMAAPLVAAARGPARRKGAAGPGRAR